MGTRGRDAPLEELNVINVARARLSMACANRGSPSLSTWFAWKHQKLHLAEERTVEIAGDSYRAILRRLEQQPRNIGEREMVPIRRRVSS